MMMSRISTDCTVMPQPLVLASRTFWISGGKLKIEPHYRGSLCGEQKCGEQANQGLMALWTSDRWRSTLHRVALPPKGHHDEDRYSMAFFHTPNWAAEVTPLPSGTTEEIDLTEPVLAGPWLQAKFQAASTGG